MLDAGQAGEKPPPEAEQNVQSGSRTHNAQQCQEMTTVRLVTVVLALVSSIFLCALDMTIIATAIPRITDEFASLDNVGWYSSAFFLTVASSQSSWGKAYRYFDLKTVFLISIGVFEIGNLICGVAGNSTTLIIGRAITGLGAAGVLAGCYCIIACSVAAHKRPAFTGILAATYGVASMIVPLLGGAFTDNVSWRWCFYINLPIGAVSVAIILCTFSTPKLQREDPARSASLKEKVLQMDLPGAISILVGIVCLLLALQWGGITYAWSSPEVIGMLVGFGVLAVVFVVIEYFQGERAMLVPHLLKKREVRSGGAFTFFLGAAFFVLLYYLPIYFQAVMATSAVESGIRNLAMIIAVTVFTIACGGFISYVGYFAPLIVLGAIMTTVGIGMIYTFDEASSPAIWIGYQVLAGVGIGLCFQPPIMAAQALSGQEDLPTTTAMLIFFQTLGGAIFVSVAQAIFGNVLLTELQKRVPTVNPAEIVAVGATELRAHFGPEVLPGIIASYTEGLQAGFILAIALAGVSVLASFFSPWVSIKGKVIVGAA